MLARLPVSPNDLLDIPTANAAAVHPIAGKPTGKEVLVQGKHVQIVTDLLISKGLPKKWMEASDLSKKK